jgi:hypothetical protein
MPVAGHRAVIMVVRRLIITATTTTQAYLGAFAVDEIHTPSLGLAVNEGTSESSPVVTIKYAKLAARNERHTKSPWPLGANLAVHSGHSDSHKTVVVLRFKGHSGDHQ